MIVDAHAHVWGKGFIPRAFYLDAAQKWARKDPGRTPEMILPRLLDGVVDEDGRLFVENMDRAGVDVTLVNSTDFGIHWCGEEPPVPMEKQLKFYGELHQRYPRRLYPFFFADPRRKDSVSLMERAVKEYGCIGCGEFTPRGFHVTDEMVQPFFRKLAELKVPVFIHTRAGHGTEMTSQDNTIRNSAHPFHMKALQAAYPDLVLIFGHAGYPLWWGEACRIARGNPNSYLDLSNWSSELSNKGELCAKLACMRDMVGADHILFASDQVSGIRFCGERSDLPVWVDFIKNLPEEARNYGYQFTEGEVSLILGGNAQRIFNL